jgi:large subunit ribosomal protein L9
MQRRAERESHELNTMTELSKSLSKLVCVVTVKTGEDGKMFGSVTNGMIADQLKTQFDVSLDKRKIHFEHPIRAVGDHEIELRLHPSVTTTLKVRVESTTPPPALPEASAPAEAKVEQRTEKRGRRQEAAAPSAEAGDKKGRGPRPERSSGGKPGGHQRPAKGEKAAEGRKS